MRTYLIKRLLLIIPTLLGISIITFLLLQFVPGGPVEQMIYDIKAASRESGTSSESSAITQEEIENLKRHFGFDKPIHIRYFKWLWGMLRFDFGESYHYQEPVTKIIARRFPISLTFGIVSFILSYLICIPLGVFKAVKHKKRFDNLTSIVIFTAYAIPGFALGILLLTFLAGGEFLSIFPLSGIVSDNFEDLSLIAKIFDFIHHMILPIICYVIGSFTVLTLLMKNSLMEELGKDYIKTALAKGISYKRVIFKHALRNALIPIATGFGRI
ncbi:ABC transporter permease subunit, partial [Spirochaetota bacterium]